MADHANVQPQQNNKDYNDEIESKKYYAITITFKHLHCKTPKGQFKETAPYLTKLLKRSTDFSIIPEFRISNNSIHYHGIISINDRIKWHKSTLPSLQSLGFICIKPLKQNGFDGWVKYYHKEIDICNAILGNLFPLDSEIAFKAKEKDIKIDSVFDMYILKCTDENSEENVKEDSVSKD